MKLKIGDRVKYKDMYDPFDSHGEGTLIYMGTEPDRCYVDWDIYPTFCTSMRLEDITWASLEQTIYNHDFEEKIQDRLG